MRMKVAIAILLIVLIVMIPLFTLREAEFGGADDAAGGVVAEVHSAYEPWATPILEVILGGELSGEVETLFFCIQTGIGVGIIAFYMGRLVERKKHRKE